MLAGQQDPEAFYIKRILPAKVALYKDYVQKQSFFYDLGLIVLTVLALLLPPVRSRLRCGGV